MNRKIAIVSASNDEYFYLLDGLIASLEDRKLPDEYQLCAYDVGMTGQQVEKLRSRKVVVAAPEWTLVFPNQEKAPSWFRAMTNRPTLPRYFPGYETYVWIDADAWIQDSEGIIAAVEAAKGGKIAIAAEKFGKSIVFPVQLPTGGYKPVLLNEQTVRRNLANCYLRCFGAENEHRAQEMLINTGFFALRGDSAIWDQWLGMIQQGVARAYHKLVEQQALNLGILEGKIGAELLDSRFNWNMAANEPLYDVKAGKLLDPVSRKVVGMVHLTDLKKLHFVGVPNLEGKKIRLRMRYRDFRDHATESEDWLLG